MQIETDYKGEGFDIEYHARQIRDAIAEALRDGFWLDTGFAGDEVRDLDLNHGPVGDVDSYIQIAENGILLREMMER